MQGGASASSATTDQPALLELDKRCYTDDEKIRIAAFVKQAYHPVRWWEALGLNESHTLPAYKKRYRGLCVALHPDKGTQSDESQAAILREAYDLVQKIKVKKDGTSESNGIQDYVAHIFNLIDECKEDVKKYDGDLSVAVDKLLLNLTPKLRNEILTEEHDSEKVDLLQFATIKGFYELPKKLIELGAKIKITPEASFMHIAVNGGNPELIDYLAHTHQLKIDEKNAAGLTPLICAAYKGNKAVVEKLFQLGADIKTTTADGLNALHQAAAGGGTELVDYLIDQHHFAIDATASDGTTPIHLAARYGKLEVLKQLKARGASTAPLSGVTILHLAATSANPDLVEYIVKELKIAVNEKTTEGQASPLHIAASNGNAEIIKRLVELGANVDEGNVGGETPLHLAAHGGHMEAVKTLLQNGADINLKSQAGLDAIGYAKLRKREEVVSYLTEILKQRQLKITKQVQEDIVRNFQQAMDDLAYKAKSNTAGKKPAKDTDTKSSNDWFENNYGAVISLSSQAVGIMTTYSISDYIADHYLNGHIDYMWQTGVFGITKTTTQLNLSTILRDDFITQIGISGSVAVLFGLLIFANATLQLHAEKSDYTLNKPALLGNIAVVMTFTSLATGLAVLPAALFEVQALDITVKVGLFSALTAFQALISNKLNTSIIQ